MLIILIKFHLKLKKQESNLMYKKISGAHNNLL